MSIDCYDYWITLPETPAFEDNIAIMVTHIGRLGTAPTIASNISSDIHLRSSGAAIGTRAAAGKVLLHFRLDQLLEGSDLTDWLEEGMSNPKPPLSTEVTRSSQKIIPTVTGTDPETGEDIVTMTYHDVVIANKATFLPYMEDVSDGVDGNGDPIMRPPNMGDDLYLSGYYGSEPIEL